LREDVMRIGSGSIAATVLMVVVLSVASADAAVRYVALDGSGANGQTWATAYRTIQAAVDDPAVGAGDEIRVKQGTYVIASPIEVNKAVKIYGGYSGSDATRDWNTYQTTIDCADEAKRGFSLFASARIDGFTITQGHSWGIPPNEGGAIWIDKCSPVVANCTFYRNYSEENGGAISTYRAHGATIVDCAFIENAAEYYGGAIYNSYSNLTIAGCTFTDNEARATDDDVDPNDPIPGGGAIFNEDSDPTISDCVLAGNSAYYGAGISNYFSDAYVEGCIFADCGAAAVAGGGIYNYGCSATIKGCSFQDNSVTYIGGAVLDLSTSTFVNCIMSGNSAYFHGGAIYVHRATLEADSAAVFTNCTVYGNHAVKGGGLYSDNAKPALANCIVWGNTALSDVDGPGIWDSRSVWSGAGVAVTYCDIQGNSTYEGTGNVRVEPGFVHAAGGNFELPFGSPCIDIGDNQATSLPTDDYEGKPRVMDGNEDGVAVVDMGAFEFQGRYVSDYLMRARAFQTKIYDDPSDTVSTHVLLLEFETSSNVDYIEFQTPGGRTFTIPASVGILGRVQPTESAGRLWRRHVPHRPSLPGRGGTRNGPVVRCSEYRHVSDGTDPDTRCVVSNLWRRHGITGDVLLGCLHGYECQSHICDRHRLSHRR
jgi:predicted outer membrane repeat protein